MLGGLRRISTALVVVVVPPSVIVARLAELVVSITVTIVAVVTAIPVVVTVPIVIGVSITVTIVVVIVTAIPGVVPVPIVIGVWAIRLGVPSLEALAVVKAAELVANRAGWIETETRAGVPPPYDQSVIEASSLLERRKILRLYSLPTTVYPAIVVTVAPPPVLGESD